MREPKLYPAKQHLRHLEIWSRGLEMVTDMLLMSVISLAICTITFLFLSGRVRNDDDYVAGTIYDIALRNSKIGIFFSILFVLMSLF